MRDTDEVRRLIMLLRHHRQHYRPNGGGHASATGHAPVTEHASVGGDSPNGNGFRRGTDVQPVDTSAIRGALNKLFHGHEPFLAFAVDSRWDLVAANFMLEFLVGPVDPALLVPPINMLRLLLNPAGMAPRIANLTQVHSHLTRRLHRQIARGEDDSLVDLAAELASYRQVPETAVDTDDADPIVVPVRLWVGTTLLNLISTSAFFGTRWECNMIEPTAEFLFPADEDTRRFLFNYADRTAEPSATEETTRPKN